MKLIKDLIKWYEDQINNYESYEAGVKILGINTPNNTQEIYKATLEILKNIKEEYEEVCVGELEKGDIFIYDDKYFKIIDIVDVIGEVNKKVVQATPITSAVGIFFNYDVKVYHAIKDNLNMQSKDINNIQNIINNTTNDIDEINEKANKNDVESDTNEHPKDKFYNFIYEKLVNKFPSGSLTKDNIKDLIISVTMNKNEFDVLNVTYRHPTKHMNLVQRISMEELCTKTDINYETYLDESGLLNIFD